MTIEEEKKIKIEKAIDLLELFSSTILIIFCIVLLIGTMTYFRINYNQYGTMSDKLFIMAVVITVVTVIVEWIDGRLKAIKRIIDNRKGIKLSYISPIALQKSKGGNNGRRKRSRDRSS